MGLLPQSAVFLLAVTGIVLWLLGARRLGSALVAPAIWRWLLWPLVTPFLAQVPIMVWLLLAVAGLPLLPFAAVWLLQRRFVNPIFGEHTGAHVGGVFLVRVIDSYLGMLVRLAKFLFRRPRKSAARRR